MKKLLIIGVAILLIFYFLSGGEDATSIMGYRGVVRDATGNVVELTSGLRVRLIGVQPNRTDVEIFVKNNYIGKNVMLVPDSKGDQSIPSIESTVGAYVVLDENRMSLNHLVVEQYEDAYLSLELQDSTGWVSEKPDPIVIPDLALYMKQRTFLIEVHTSKGKKFGTGFFINEDGLAITNWHVLPDGAERISKAFLYTENPDDSKIYLDKKRNIKNVLWSENTDGMDVSIFSVELENNEKVPYFRLAKQVTAVGRDCATFGNPLGVFTASYSAGHISAYRDDVRRDRTVTLMQYSMSTNGGNSGGPVCDKYGQVIAIHEMGIKTAQGINFGIDVQQVRKVLDNRGFKYGGK